MISLNEFLYEALSATDKFAKNDFYSVEKFKLNNGKKAYWGSATESNSCIFPGKGVVKKIEAKKYCKSISDDLIKILKLDTSVFYKDRFNRDFYTSDCESRIHFISNQTTKAKAEKDENCEDFVIVTLLNFSGDDAIATAIKNENKYKKEIAKFCGVDEKDIFIEKIQDSYKKQDGSNEKYNSLSIYYTIYFDKLQFEQFISKY